jgi:thiamine biosynthesis lipoprotein
MSNRFSLFLLLLAVVSLSSCNHGKYYYLEGPAQGTFYHVTYKGQQDFSHEIDSVLRVIDKSLSAWDSTSIISRINRNDPSVRPDSLFIKVFNRAKQVNAESNGNFDITVGPLVKAWGFYDKTKTIPDSSEIKDLLKLVGMDKVKLVNGKVMKQNPSMMLDVNAIAQGFSVDVVAEFMEKNGIHDYLVEIGGELKSKGKNPNGGKWLVGIDKPEENIYMPGEELQTVVQISGRAMATSGNYRHFIEEKGVKYGHHLNPKTGYPSKNPLLSVTIVANDCMTADAYATACIVSGLEKTKEFLKVHNDVDACLIYSDRMGRFKVYTTERLAAMVKK